MMENKKISTDKELGWRSLGRTDSPMATYRLCEGRKDADGWIIVLLITKVDGSQTEKRGEQLQMLHE